MSGKSRKVMACNICHSQPRQGGKGSNRRICKRCDAKWSKCAARHAVTPEGNEDIYPALEWAAERARWG